MSKPVSDAPASGDAPAAGAEKTHPKQRVLVGIDASENAEYAFECKWYWQCKFPENIGYETYNPNNRLGFKTNI